MTIDTIIRRFVPPASRPETHGNVVTFPADAADILSVCRTLHVTHGLPLETITAVDMRAEGGGFRVYYLFGVPEKNVFVAPFLSLVDTEEFPSITREMHAASGFERKIWSFFGLTPAGHPHLRGMLLHENWPEGVFPLRRDFDWRTRPAEGHGEYRFQKVDGEGIYEIPVGPVHAGIIEPGHFRFSVAGEEIILLEPRLGYTHKGTEKLFETLPADRLVALSERVSGDTSFTHSLAFCQAMEQLTGTAVPRRAAHLRVVYSELERLANHFNDIGFIMLDAGYNFGGSNGARLREVVMQWHERLTGGRFLRGVNVVGGVTRDIDERTRAELRASLDALHAEFTRVIGIAESSNSLHNRLAGTGRVDLQTAMDHGLVGVAGRANGIARDARIDHPYAAYGDMDFDIALENDGDVRARWAVRIKEVHTSMAILGQALASMPADGAIRAEAGPVSPPPDSCAVGVAEGWRGEIVYFIVTDREGRIARVDVRDPSFINWTVLEHAGKGNVVPDFPLINKSFNLSYSGNDV